MLNNNPKVNTAIVAVSRDCFPSSLSKSRLDNVISACKQRKITLYRSDVIVENENDALAALADINAAGANALIVFLGNFGPEGPETILAQRFDGPVMFVAAAEETKNNMIDGRGDAFCGMLNASYNLALRKINAYIPEYPVGTPDDIAGMIADFSVIAKIKIGLSKLKVFSFGPRPYDFLACNAPIKGLFDLGVEIQENSELDLYEAFLKHENDKRIPAIIEEMKKEFSEKTPYMEVLPKLAQYEITLTDWAENNRGASEYVVFANKCWPAFQTMFHFVPCFVNSRLAARGIPVACETDIYGAVSEYILYLASGKASTLLDINNTVPRDAYEADIKKAKGYKLSDMFMGFHCGNTASCMLKSPKMGYQLIMKRNLEPDSEPNISRGTIEGELITSPVTLFRLQCAADTSLSAYVAEGETLDIPTNSFGSIGVIAVPELGRFYRHVLIEKNYPHHAGIGFDHCAKNIFSALKLLGVKDIGYNQPASLPYPGENPFGK